MAYENKIKPITYKAEAGDVYITTPFGKVKVMTGCGVVTPVEEFAEHIAMLLNRHPNMQKPSLDETPHEYNNVNLGHAMGYCRHCGGTYAENALLGDANHCPARTQKESTDG